MSIPFDVMNVRSLRGYWQSVITGGNKDIIENALYNYCGACEILVKDVSSVKVARAVYEEKYTAYKAVLAARAKILPRAQEAYAATYDAVKADTGKNSAAKKAANLAYDKVWQEFPDIDSDNYFTLTRTKKAYENLQFAIDKAFVSLYGV